MKETLTICWPKGGGMPLFLRESEPEEKGFDDGRHMHCRSSDVSAALLDVDNKTETFQFLKGLVFDLEEDFSVVAGSPDGPIVYGSRGSASVYRVKGGWVVSRVWPEAPKRDNHNVLQYAFYTSNSLDDTVLAFLMDPDTWAARQLQTVPEASPGVRMRLEIPSQGSQDGAALSADFKPQGEEVYALNFKSFGVIVTKDGCALVLSGGLIDSIKAFGPHHSRIMSLFTDERDQEAFERIRLTSVRFMPPEDVLAVRAAGYTTHEKSLDGECPDCGHDWGIHLPEDSRAGAVTTGCLHGWTTSGGHPCECSHRRAS